MIPIFWCANCNKGYCDCKDPINCIDPHTIITELAKDVEVCEDCYEKLTDAKITSCP